MAGLIPVANELTDDLTAQLPDDVQEFVAAQAAQREQIIDGLAKSIIESRSEAIKFRESSGIENEWKEDEEFYDGIDDANRSEPRMIKPNHPSGGVMSTVSKNKKVKSTVFPNITRPYVNSAAASVSELNNPNDDRNFVLKPKPDAELNGMLDDNTPYTPQQQQQPGFLQRVAAFFSPPQPAAQMTNAQYARMVLDDRNKRVKRAQDQIDSWLIECKWHGAMRDAVHRAAKVGTGILKGPIPTTAKRRKTQHTQDGVALVIEDEIIPGSKEVSCWNIYPDPTCGSSIHNGSYVFEKDELNARQVRELKELDGYIGTQIDKALKSGPRSEVRSESNAQHPQGENKDKYTVWYYYGMLTREQIEAIGVKDQYDEEDQKDKKTLNQIENLEACPCIVTLIEDVPVKASLNPLDSGEFPYDFIVWETRENCPWGTGIARIGRDAQRITTAAVRNLMDNAGASSGVVLGIKKGAIKPANGGSWRIGAGAVFELIDESIDDINKALSSFEVPSRQQELMAIIEFGQKLFEDATGMPLLLQGQTGSAPDTVGGMQLLNQNATSTRRMVARRIDDEMVEPHMRRYYDWVMMYGEDNMKCDMTIDARGSQALVERDIQRQMAQNLLEYAANPIYGINAYKSMAEVLRSNSCTPADWQYTEEQFKAIMAQQQQAGNPVVQAAKIRADATLQAAQIHASETDRLAQTRAAAEIQSTQLRTERDAETAERMQRELEQDGVFKMRQLELTREIALLEYATKQNINLSQVKAELAQTAMRLQTEKELAGTAASMQQAESLDEARQSAVDTATQHAHERIMQAQEHAHDLHVANLKPEVQLPGRAAPGQALSQMPGPKKTN